MKIIKSKLFYFILGGILFSSITALAVTTISASQITYTDKNNVEKTVDTVLDDLYNNLYKIQRGSINFTNVSSSWQYETIYFEKEFATTPKIYFDTNGGSGYSSLVKDITTSSFTIGAYKSYSSGDITVNWIAYSN